MEIESYGEIECTINIETLKNGRLIGKRQTLNKCYVQLGRDEFRDIILKINNAKYELKDFKILGKFIKEGKATLIFSRSQTNIMFSNAPPDKLSAFLKTMKIKTGIQKTYATERMKLYSSKKKCFDEISPLTVNDLNTFKKVTYPNFKSPGAKSNGTKRKASDTTPLRVKRKPSDENSGPRKRLNSSPLQVVKLGTKTTNSKPNNIENKGSLKNDKVLKETTNTKGTQEVLEKSDKKINMMGNLTKEQQKILKAVHQGYSIFFTGGAGTGKSYLLRKIIGSLPPDVTVASASTGVAACQIGGITLHSFAGIGSGEASIEQCIKLASRPSTAQKWKRCKTLIIDEISMTDASFFDKLEHVARVIRGNDLPFGGIQLVLCGDFLQLPPVKKQKEALQFCFQSKKWLRCIQVCFELTEVKRQSDKEFINILQHIRLGKCPDEIYDKLLGTMDNKIENHGIEATRLCTHNDNVGEINQEKMRALKNQSKVFIANDSDLEYVDQLDKVLPVLHKLELKVGAQPWESVAAVNNVVVNAVLCGIYDSKKIVVVMLTKNLDVSKGLVNGARGVVTKFMSDLGGLPMVKFSQGIERVIKREKFIMKTGSTVVTRVQLPLKLAWAISIHKSQGLTLDCCEVSLSRVFEHGQAYVALSRAKRLEGLRILDISKTSIRANKEVLKFYIRLRRDMRINGFSKDQENVDIL